MRNNCNIAYLLQIADLIRFHKRIHRHAANAAASDTSRALLSNDGVAECKGSSVSHNVFSLRFRNCGLVYPIAIVRPLRGFKHDSRESQQVIIDDLK